MKEKTKKLYHNVIDITGKTYGKLTVVSFIKSDSRGSHWLCRCECGNLKEFVSSELRRKRGLESRSCGCFFRKKNSKLGKKRLGELSPAWNPDREYIHKLNKCKKFMYKQLASLLGTKRGIRSHKTLGYTNKELAEHLESQFDENMTWDNYGSYWHIDHIYPISYFIKCGITDPAIINSLDNLQPLEATENIKKSDRII